jgi:glutathione S-transferase
MAFHSPITRRGWSPPTTYREEFQVELYFAETMNSYKTCAVARYLDLDVEFRRVDLRKGEQRSPEFLAINLNGKAPALVDGERKLWESNAIICYLAMKANSDIWPRDERQVEIVKWFNWSADHFSRFAGQLYFENIIRAEFGIGQPDPDAVKEATGYVRRYAAILNDHLAGRRYLLDDQLTVADFVVATTLPYASRAGIPVDEVPASQSPFTGRN